MDRALIISCLQAAETEVANSERLIVNQCKLIWSLERAGEDATRAIALFREMERRQLEHLDDRDQLLAELRMADAVDRARTNASAITVSRLDQRRKRSA
jgi:hypothetical protein